MIPEGFRVEVGAVEGFEHMWNIGTEKGEPMSGPANGVVKN